MIGADVLAARRKLGMTQSELGEAVGLKLAYRSRTVRNWENGGNIPGPAALAITLLLRVRELEKDVRSLRNIAYPDEAPKKRRKA